MPILTNFQTRNITDADRSGPLGEIINRNGATTLTTVNEELLSQVSIKNNYPTVVISILGNSRSGKSAFLNCIISYAKSQNIAAFKSMSSKASKGLDVTHGMNYYVISDDKTKINYLFIDVQGLGGEISVADPTVLLFTYYISDIIIVNHRGRFESATLQVLTPITTLIAKLQSKPVHPLLLFRIFDVDEDYDNILAEQNYQVVMKPRDDQYAGVRQCLTELFIITKPPILFTRVPSKKTRDNFDSGNFCDAINDSKDSLYFEHAAVSIMNLVNGIKGETDKVKYIQSVAKNINSHSADINASVFDTSSQVTMNDVSIWIYGSTFLKQGQTAIASMVPAELSKDIAIKTGTAAEWQMLIDPRIKMVADTVKAFETRFSAIPKDIKDQGLAKLNAIIQPALELAIATSNKFAEEICSNILAAAYVELARDTFSDLVKYDKYFDDFYINTASRIRNGGANFNITNKCTSMLHKRVDELKKHFSEIHTMRERLENKALNDTIQVFKTYNYQAGLTPYLSQIIHRYDECARTLADLVINSQSMQIKPPESGIMAKLVSWFSGTSKLLAPTLYKVDIKNFTFYAVENPTMKKDLSITLESYNSKYWDSLAKAKETFISKFENHREWFEETRFKNLQGYLDNQSPANLDEREKFYDTIQQHNECYMIKRMSSTISKYPAYIYLTQAVDIDVHRIYTPANYVANIPAIIRKHADAILDYNSSKKTLGIKDFMAEQLYLAWYNHCISSVVYADDADQKSSS